MYSLDRPEQMGELLIEVRLVDGITFSPPTPSPTPFFPQNARQHEHKRSLDRSEQMGELLIEVRHKPRLAGTAPPSPTTTNQASPTSNSHNACVIIFTAPSVPGPRPEHRLLTHNHNPFPPVSQALATPPIAMFPLEQYALSWEAATERLLDAAALPAGTRRPKERPLHKLAYAVHW
jgi:hypothetical protein